MSRRLFPLLVSLLAVSLPFLPAQDASADDMAAAMAQAAKYTQPGPNHAALQRFVGTWDCETSFVMGGQKSPPEKSVLVFDWLYDGRWLQGRLDGTMMGMPTSSTQLLGYDNFKQSFVSTTVGTLDTAMLRAEGDLTPDGKAMLLYGTLDEYLTGEHDKMVKYVYRFLDDDTIVQEVHDLPIGETGTQVIEIVCKRRK